MSAPAWHPVDDTTHDLLSLVRSEGHPSADHEWLLWLAAVRTVAAPDGRVDPNRLRAEVRGVVAPRRLGAFTNRALAAGLLVWRGDYVTSTDRVGGNAGRPIREYFWTGGEEREGGAASGMTSPCPHLSDQADEGNRDGLR